MNPTHKWLTSELKLEIRKMFEPKYNRELTDSEVEDIAENLTNGMEVILKYKYDHEMKKKHTK